MTNLEVLLSRRAKLMEKLNGILAGMCDDDETEITNKITRINFVITKIKRQRIAVAMISIMVWLLYFSPWKNIGTD